MKDKKTTPRQAVFTDIDNTFFRHDRADDSRRLAQFLAEKGILLIAVTGADFGSVLARIEAGELPRFDIIAAAVGTEIYFRTDEGAYEIDRAWQRRLRSGSFATLRAPERMGQLIDELREMQQDWNLVFQNAASQSQFKTSAHYHAHASSAAQIAAELAAHFGGCRTVWCEDINFSDAGETRRYCFDVLAADKRDAVDYLFAKLRLRGGWVAGDSGNDITMLLETNEQLVSVVVGGSRAELLLAVQAYAGSKIIFTETDPTRLGPQSIQTAVNQFLGS